MDVNSILKSVLGSGGGGIKEALTSDKRTFGEGLAGGAAVGGLAGLLLSSKKSRKVASKALTYGGIIAAGGLAYKVWKDRQPNTAGTTPSSAPQVSNPATPEALPTPPTGSIFDMTSDPADPQTDMRLVLLRAMISAAKSDGHIDGDERARIEEQIREMQVGQEEQRYLVEQLKAPSDPIAIAKLSSCEEQALEIYAASLLAVDIDTPEERRYLDRLAGALLLSDDLRSALEAETASFQSSV